MQSVDKMFAAPVNPKLENLFEREKEGKDRLITPGLRLPEFALINTWSATEKVDGTSMRVRFSIDGDMRLGYAFISGRTDKADISDRVAQAMVRALDLRDLEHGVGVLSDVALARFAQTFELPREDGSTFDMSLYGEAYGPGVQSGGRYRHDVNFRAFDIRIGHWWLNQGTFDDITMKLGIQTVPRVLENVALWNIVQYVFDQPRSAVADLDGGDSTLIMEGVVARTEPLLLRRDGGRVMFKLKSEDIAKVYDRVQDEFAWAVLQGTVSELS